MLTREPEFYPPPINWFGWLGRQVWLSCRNAGRALLMLWEALLDLRFIFGARAWPEVVYQLYVTGIKSIGVISVVAMFTGMILALQTGLELRKFGQEVNIGAAVMISLLREMGPFMTALILAASVGSAMAAELGTMVVSERKSPRWKSCPFTGALPGHAPPGGDDGNALDDILRLHAGRRRSHRGCHAVGRGLAGYMDNATRFCGEQGSVCRLFKSFVFGHHDHDGLLPPGVLDHRRRGGRGANHPARSVIISFLSILIVGYIITRLFYV